MPKMINKSEQFVEAGLTGIMLDDESTRDRHVYVDSDVNVPVIWDLSEA